MKAMQADRQIDTRMQEPVVFHLTGRRQGVGMQAIAGLGLRPALLAPYRDLVRLRYDFPLVLVADGHGAAPVRSLSRIVDELLQKIAPAGTTSERLRRLVLRLEREIRTLAAEGATGSLAQLWERAADRLDAGTDRSPGTELKLARAALEVDGEVLDCNATTAARVVAHVGAAVREEKARAFRLTASRLAVKLADILRVDFIHSDAGGGVDRLRAAIGPAHHELFNFDRMSRLLPKPSPREAMPQRRRRRVEWALAALTNQRFFAAAAGQARSADAPAPYTFEFASCTEAVAAFRERLPEMVELTKALAVAELEVDGSYVESGHDVFFAGYDAGTLGPEDLAAFPDYLVTLDSGRGDATGNAGLMEALSSGVPLKVLVNVHDVLEEPAVAEGHLGFGTRGVQLASAALGINDVFVLQSTSSNLFQMRDRILRALTSSAPALMTVFSGATDGGLAPYLCAAAAMQSRAFPAFTYDPGAGPDLASRFSLENNPQSDLDWTMHDFEYADDELQRIKAPFAFTFVDFLLGDPRHARHFAKATRSHWHDGTVPMAAWMSGERYRTPDAVPYVLAVDANEVLHRVIVDDRVMAAARRCLEMWHRLQENGGVHNSHAERLLAREKAAWDAQKQREIDGLKVTDVAPSLPASPPAAADAAPEPERSSDDPSIETGRCSSCNECIQINDRMFAYNDNKQAYLADVNAGTYRQLVEAAESCQLGIIHPGKPRNPAEPGLEELRERAAPFL
jgi:hypothetical protein